MRGSRWADQQASFDDMAARVPGNMTNCAQYVQQEGLRGDYVCGDQFSIADAYLFVVCNWLEGDGVDLSNLPMIQAYLARIETRPSVQSIRARDML